MSMRTVGSIDVEHRIKPVKNEILSKTRNRLSDSKATVLYRTSENLNHLMKAIGRLKTIIDKRSPIQLLRLPFSVTTTDLLCLSADRLAGRASKIHLLQPPVVEAGW